MACITGGTELVLYTPVTTAELWHGLRPGEDAAVREVLDTLICVPLNDEIGRRAGSYLRQFHRSRGLDIGNALIAAAAAVHGCVVDAQPKALPDEGHRANLTGRVGRRDYIWTALRAAALGFTSC